MFWSIVWCISLAGWSFILLVTGWAVGFEEGKKEARAQVEMIKRSIASANRSR